MRKLRWDIQLAFVINMRVRKNFLFNVMLNDLLWSHWTGSDEKYNSRFRELVIHMTHVNSKANRFPLKRYCARHEGLQRVKQTMSFIERYKMFSVIHFRFFLLIFFFFKRFINIYFCSFSTHLLKFKWKWKLTDHLRDSLSNKAQQ